MRSIDFDKFSFKHYRRVNKNRWAFVTSLIFWKNKITLGGLKTALKQNLIIIAWNSMKQFLLGNTEKFCCCTTIKALLMLFSICPRSIVPSCTASWYLEMTPWTAYSRSKTADLKVGENLNKYRVEVLEFSDWHLFNQI